MASSWSNKLETRLSALGDGPSRESLQSLAQWIGFNRKHNKAFCVSLDKQLQQDNAMRQWLYLQIIHEVLLLEKNNPTKWDRLSETRTMLGESVIIPALKRNNVDIKARIAPLLDEWESANAFGTPALITEIKRLLSSDTKEEAGTIPSKPAETAAAPAKAEPKTEPIQVAREVTVEAIEEPKETVVKEEEVNMKVEPKKSVSKPIMLRRASSGVGEEVSFDFEGSGIPYSKVESREFMEPCKAIATLQIARDLRNDAAVQLSSRLSALPEEVKELCREAQEQQDQDGTALELSEEQAEKMAELIGDDLLDTDLDEALANVKTFMRIVEQQKQARQQLIQLLIQSRCQFGSDEAAKVFYSLDAILKDLKARKQLLTDAMDLEGFEEGSDFKAHDCTEAEKKAAALEPLSWYNSTDEPDAKRAKLSE